jgi:hypothetical protein
MIKVWQTYVQDYSILKHDSKLGNATLYEQR